MVHDGEAAEHDVAEEVIPEMTHRRHHPAHAERGADLFRLSGAVGARADDLLQRHDVGVQRADDLDNP